MTARTGAAANRPGTAAAGQAGAGAGAENAAAVWRAMRALVLDNERRREACDAVGLSFVRVKALVRLARAPMTMTELATALSTDAPYTTVVVGDLERRGLAERRVHPVDRRAKVVVATRRGLQLAARAGAVLDSPPPELAGSPPADLEVLARVLGTLTGRADGADRRDRPRRDARGQ